MNGWKQPISPELDNLFGDDYLAEDIFIFSIVHATNKTKTVSRNGKVTVLLRGQCYATTTYLAKRFRAHRDTVRKALKRLYDLYNVTNNDTDNFGTIITINNYDNMVSFNNGINNDTDNSTNNEPTTAQQRLYTNKSVESVKNEKTTFSTNPGNPVGSPPITEKKPLDRAALLDLANKLSEKHKEASQ